MRIGICFFLFEFDEWMRYEEFLDPDYKNQKNLMEYKVASAFD